MPYPRAVQKWDIYWADLNPIRGREQAGESRPVLIVSNDSANKFSDLVTVLPLTKLEGKGREPRPYEVVLPRCISKNQHTSLALPNQIRSIDKERLMEFAGRLDNVTSRYEIEGKILDHLGIDLDE